MTPLVDPYAVLGVTSQATQEEINSAYRRLVRRYHPDAAGRSAGTSALLERVLAAYAVLRDPDRRAEYDRRHPVPAGPQMPPGMMRTTLTIRVRPLHSPGPVTRRQVFCGKPRFSPPWDGSSHRLVIALVRVKKWIASGPYACESPNSDCFHPPKE